MKKLTLQEKRDYLIKTVTQMKRDIEGDYSALTCEDFKMENLIKEYNRLSELDNTYEYFL